MHCDDDDVNILTERSLLSTEICSNLSNQALGLAASSATKAWFDRRFKNHLLWDISLSGVLGVKELLVIGIISITMYAARRND